MEDIALRAIFTFPAMFSRTLFTLAMTKCFYVKKVLKFENECISSTEIDSSL